MSKSIVIFLLFLATQLVAFCGAVLVDNAGRLTGDAVGAVQAVRPATLGAVQLAADAVLVVLLTLTRLVRRHPLTCGLRTGAAPYVAGVAGVLLAALGLDLLLQPLALGDGGQMEVFREMSRSVPCVVLLCLVGPLVEELVFREGILRHLGAAGLGPLGACIVSALVFGAVHANWAQAVPAVALGFLLGLLYLRTGDIRLSLPAHVLNNCVAVGLMYVPDGAQPLSGLGAAGAAVLGAVLLAAGLAAVLAGAAPRFNVKETPRL